MKFIIIILVFVSVLVNAQDDGKNIFNKLNVKKAGDVRVYQSTQIRLSMEKHLASIVDKKGIEGYRIQIYSGNGKNARQKTSQIRVNFISEYENVKAHVVYNNPYFRVKVGDFRTKSEALSFLTKIKANYPSSYIVNDIIEIEK